MGRRTRFYFCDITTAHDAGFFPSTALSLHVFVSRCFSESSRINADYDAIVERATEVEGLTGHQLRRLEEAKSDGPKKMLSRVEKLRQTAYELMKHDYGLFRKKLLKDGTAQFRNKCAGTTPSAAGSAPQNSFRPN